MSLDVSLKGKMKPCDRCSPCPDCDGKREYQEEVWGGNVTHNLVPMAVEVGVPFYKSVWHPDEVGITKAHQMIPILEEGLQILHASPEKFKRLNPSNGWGSYDGFCRFVDAYLRNCRENHDADVRAWA